MLCPSLLLRTLSEKHAGVILRKTEKYVIDLCGFYSQVNGFLLQDNLFWFCPFREFMIIMIPFSPGFLLVNMIGWLDRVWIGCCWLIGCFVLGLVDSFNCWLQCYAKKSIHTNEIPV